MERKYQYLPLAEELSRLLRFPLETRAEVIEQEREGRLIKTARATAIAMLPADELSSILTSETLSEFDRAEVVVNLPQRIVLRRVAEAGEGGEQKVKYLVCVAGTKSNETGTLTAEVEACEVVEDPSKIDQVREALQRAYWKLQSYLSVLTR